MRRSLPILAEPLPALAHVVAALLAMPTEPREGRDIAADAAQYANTSALVSDLPGPHWSASERRAVTRAIRRAASAVEHAERLTLRSYARGSIVDALLSGAPVWCLDTGNSGEDDTLLGTRDEVTRCLADHHGFPDAGLPDEWSLTRVSLPVRYMLLTRRACMPGRCMGASSYVKIALVEVDPWELADDGITEPRMLSARSIGCIRVVRVWDRLYMGTTAECAYGRAMVEATAYLQALTNGDSNV